jgi:ribosomal protein S18 acetylase RimI-like enzyme
MHYRQATATDATLLGEMNHRLICDEGHRNPMTLGELAGRMAEWLAAEYEAVLFEDDAGVAGYALFRREPEHIYLRQFYVEPQRRRQGIGRAAIAHFLKHHWQDRARIRVDVLIGNEAAIAFWKSVGFADYFLTLERSL